MKAIKNFRMCLPIFSYNAQQLFQVRLPYFSLFKKSSLHYPPFSISLIKWLKSSPPFLQNSSQNEKYMQSQLSRP